MSLAPQSRGLKRGLLGLESQPGPDQRVAVGPFDVAIEVEDPLGSVVTRRQSSFFGSVVGCAGGVGLAASRVDSWRRFIYA